MTFIGNAVFPEPKVGALSVGCKAIWSAPNSSLELTGLSWSFAGLVGVATGIGERGPAAWAALQLSSRPLGIFRSLDMGIMSRDDHFMYRAIELALLAEREGNLPVGAVITHDGEVVAEGRSAIWIPRFDATRHAEMEALRAVPADLWSSSDEMSLYTTLEPCLRCFASILLHGVGRVVFGSSDSYGGPSSVLAHLPPYFRERLESTQWLGPIMPGRCDPLRERLLELEKARAGQVRGEDAYR